MDAEETLLATLNDLASVEALFSAHPEDVACVILEPMMGNHGVLAPTKAFLQVSILHTQSAWLHQQAVRHTADGAAVTLTNGSSIYWLA